MSEKLRTAGVHLLDLPFHLDSEYTYYVPQSAGDVKIGSLVFVPFGRANVRRAAVVTSLDPETDMEHLKPILGAMSDELRLSEPLLALCRFVCERTVCAMGDAVKRIIPAEALSRSDELFFINDDAPEAELNAKSRLVLDYVASCRDGVTAEQAEKALGVDSAVLLRSLCSAGALRSELFIREAASANISVIYACEDADTGKLLAARTPAAQKEIFSLVSESDGIELSELTALGYTSAQVKALVKKGLVREEKCEYYRNPYENLDATPHREPVLSEEQARAKNLLYALTLDGKPHAALLHGVTGSGKTSVVLSLCRNIIDDGRTAIVLVPEIALTWQSVSAFAAVFGGRLAVIHSRLSGGERLDTFRRIRRGEVDIVLGTRSAVFAPLERLGAIIIDEEQEHTYKSEQSPKYHARDIARYRCAESGALMLLCSATPSVESYEKAKRGVYTLVELKNRYGTARLPEVIISDMRKAASPESYIGEDLRRELERTLRAGEQAVLFLNRRGYSSYMSCRLCGEAVLCSHCSVSLTYHKKRGGKGYLSCHYCGYRREVPSVCPSCGSEHLSLGGFGTQKIEDELCTLFPDARVMRMDADTTRGRFSQDEICEKFRNREADILIGTQMVTKGHNFPSVTLVGIVAADNSLFMDDFRAGERTFSLITQAVGRSGRGAAPGKAVIQTSNPDNPTICLAARQDYIAFYENDIAMRRAMSFPPYCDMAVLAVSGTEENRVRDIAASLSERLRLLCTGEFSDCRGVIFGPFEADIYKINEKYRMRMVIKFRENRRWRLLFATLMKEFGKYTSQSLSVGIDINPSTV